MVLPSGACLIITPKSAFDKDANIVRHGLGEHKPASGRLRQTWLQQCEQMLRGDYSYVITCSYRTLNAL